MGHYVPKFTPGAAITLQASAAIVGGRLVEVSGAGTVATGADDSAKIVGVAGFDAASGEKLTVYPKSGGVHSVVAAGAITAGAKVAAAADGEVQTIGSKTNAIGIALTAATADQDVIDVLFI